MAKKANLKKTVVKPADKPSKADSLTLDVSKKSILSRAATREYLPSVSYVNDYLVKDRGKASTKTVDFSELVHKYPKYKSLIEQLIAGMNETIVPNCSLTTIEDTTQGIRIFLEFLNSDKNLSNNYVTNLNDINIIVAKSFSNYLRSTYPKDTRSRKWFAAIRRIVQRLQELFPKDPSIGLSFSWPTGPGKNDGTVEGYHPREMKELIDACIEDIKIIKSFHKAYLRLDEELVTEDWNLENLMCFLHDGLIRNEESRLKQKQSKKAWIKKLIRSAPNAQKVIAELGYTIEQIQDLYIQRGLELASRGRSPFATRISQRPDQERAIAQFNLGLGTLKKRFPLFPYYLPINEAKGLLNSNNVDNSTILKAKDPLAYMVNRAIFNSCRKIKFMDGTLGKMAVHAAKHFVSDTLYPFFLLALINTGWNVESLLSISDDVDAHVTPDLIDPENYVIIHGRKIRGSNDRKFSKVTRRSNKNKMLDTYQLLKYVESIITKYKDSPYYRPGFLWQFTIPESQKDIISSFNEQPYFTLVSKRFTERHNFKYFSDTTGISHPKVRSGYVSIKQLMGETERELGEDLSQKDKGSIEHYISDESTNFVLDLAIKEIQKQFVKDLTNYKVRLVESTSLRSLRSAINDAKTEQEKLKLIKKESVKHHLDENTIIHLLDAGSQKYILACEDATNPSWPGWEDYVGEGKKCRYFNKCALCRQAIVFPEALPYIARRILDLDKLKKSHSSSEWVLKYGDEYDAWNQILEYWNNKEQVKNAWELARMGFVVLPQIMRGV
ncbi:hypothetical protein SAMN04488072_109157 [Lentibacillus halodurans]|uniref:Uncharacterized protein n=1 Tax=Lentibacillus halodurans TaxID=237679 RepID=A0A1I0Z730_9BACI|nr:hypothetical protein [Lentibacillus halodurans]SFB20390.1 hypothetical protein SAMN04488072_109157 [Lentibacillus halodurans]